MIPLGLDWLLVFNLVKTLIPYIFYRSPHIIILYQLICYTVVWAINNFTNEYRYLFIREMYLTNRILELPINYYNSSS